MQDSDFLPLTRPGQKCGSGKQDAIRHSGDDLKMIMVYKQYHDETYRYCGAIATKSLIVPKLLATRPE